MSAQSLLTAASLSLVLSSVPVAQANEYDDVINRTFDLLTPINTPITDTPALNTADICVDDRLQPHLRAWMMDSRPQVGEMRVMFGSLVKPAIDACEQIHGPTAVYTMFSDGFYVRFDGMNAQNQGQATFINLNATAQKAVTIALTVA